MAPAEQSEKRSPHGTRQDVHRGFGVQFPLVRDRFAQVTERMNLSSNEGQANGESAEW
jgi:hypothetical protein